MNNISDEHGFIHELHSLRVVDSLARNGLGLDLTYAVRDGILSHCGETFEQYIEPMTEYKDLLNIKNRATYPTTFEGCVVRVSDKIAYLGRDLEDAVMAGLVAYQDVPTEVLEGLGHSNSEMIDNMVQDVISWSRENGKIGFSPEIHYLMVQLKDFNYKHIYNHPKLLQYGKYCGKVIEMLYEQLRKTIDTYAQDFELYRTSDFPHERRLGKYLEDMKDLYERENWPHVQIIYDYIAGMTDQYALKTLQEFFIPNPINSFLV